MARHEKGILGVRKDPKNQILFSFKTRVGEEWPDDDSDSDYLPDSSDEGSNQLSSSKSGGPQASNKQTDRRKEKKNHQHGSSPRSKVKRRHPDEGNDGEKKRQRISVEVPQAQTAAPEIRASLILPPEMWLKIFQFVVSSEGSLPFLIRASKVCSIWHEVSAHPSLWEKVDLSYGWIKLTERNFTSLCENKFSQCREISLKSHKAVNDVMLKAIATNCPVLQSINLSYCKKLPLDCLVTLSDGCPQLNGVDLSYTNTEVVGPGPLKHMIEKCGHQLKHLSLGGNTIKGFGAILNKIMVFCPNLESLDVSNARFSADFVTIHIENFQSGCPKLRVLMLANSQFRAPDVPQRRQQESSGFPDLEEVSLASIVSGLVYSGDFIRRLLTSSIRLHLLDLRGCSQRSVMSELLTVPVLDLQNLYLSQSAVSGFENLNVMLRKWRHSLIELDLSWNAFKDNILEPALEVLTDGQPLSKLQSLNLAGTNVSLESLRNVLTGCKCIKTINLTSCRALPRGIKREYKKREISKLRKEVDKLH